MPLAFTRGGEMIFPWTRHYHRYEYLIQRGWIDDKLVADVGCGMPVGANAMTARARMVHAVDPKLNTFIGSRMIFFSSKGCDGNKRMRFFPQDMFKLEGEYDVIVGIEVFEHMEDPHKFIKFLSGHCKRAFLTTPLAAKTGKTRNPSHVAEYSAKDFDDIVSTGFHITDKLYQRADLSVVKNAKPNGDSFDDNHVVQMAWCRWRKWRG